VFVLCELRTRFNYIFRVKCLRAIQELQTVAMIDEVNCCPNWVHVILNAGIPLITKCPLLKLKRGYSSSFLPVLDQLFQN